MTDAPERLDEKEAEEAWLRRQKFASRLVELIVAACNDTELKRLRDIVADFDREMSVEADYPDEDTEWCNTMDARLVCELWFELKCVTDEAASS